MFRSLCVCVQSLGECAFENKNNDWNIFFSSTCDGREKTRERERDGEKFIFVHSAFR